MGMLSAAAITALPINSHSNFRLSPPALCDGFRSGPCPSAFSKRNFEAIPVVSTKVQTGFIPVSAEGTAVDLIRYARAIGGLTGCSPSQELVESMDRLKLVNAVKTDGNVAYGHG